MSSSINIPSSSKLSMRPATHQNTTEHQSAQAQRSPSSTERYSYMPMYSSSVTSSLASSVPNHSEDCPQPLSLDKGKGKARADSDVSSSDLRTCRHSGDVSQLCRNPVPHWAQSHGRRPSLMSDSFLDVEHRVVDVGCNGRMNLITCVKASQGWDWNQDIFLPSYLCDFDPMELELRQDQVADIILTEEEMKNMLPS